MINNKTFFQSAKSLAGNPLGIIALFIVLVYAVASIVISLADARFYQNPYHPAVLFLAFFPILVLAAFTHLVAYHHRNLYAPHDYADEKHFAHGLTVPSEVEGKSTGVATSDMSRPSIPKAQIDTIEARYQELIDSGFALLHQTEVLQERTSPKSGRYRVRVWIEAVGGNRSIGDIESVTYHVWHDFKNPILATSDAKSHFDLWLVIYGEFPVLALVKLRSGCVVEVCRYIDLPGRPPD